MTAPLASVIGVLSLSVAIVIMGVVAVRLVKHLAALAVSLYRETRTDAVRAVERAEVDALMERLTKCEARMGQIELGRATAGRRHG